MGFSDVCFIPSRLHFFGFEISRNTGSENQSPASSFNLRTELEALVKTGPDQNVPNSAVGLGIGSTGSAGKVAQDVSALSPVSDSLLVKIQTIACLTNQVCQVET